MMTNRPLIPLMLLAFFPLLFGGAGTESLADSGSKLQQAQGYFENSDYQQAEQIFQEIIKQRSDADPALEAQKGLVMVYISWGKQAEAEKAYQQLLSNFPHNTHMADVIHHGIACNYRKCKKDYKADELDKYVLKNWPTSESAMWAQVDIAGANINRKDFAAAQADVDNLFAGFAKNEHLCDAIHSLAYHYRQAQEAANANELDQYVVSHKSSSEGAMWAQADIINSNIDGKDYTAAQTGIDNLLTRFPSNENMANVLHGMAYKYRQAREIAKADELDKYVLNHWPSTEIALWARVDTVKSDANEQGLTTALANADNLLINFTNEEQLVFGVLAFEIVDGYRELNRDEKASQFYKKLISNWPGHKYTLWSQTIAALANIQLGDITAAEAAIDKLHTDFSTNPKFPDVMLIIAEKCYEKGFNIGIQQKTGNKVFLAKAIELLDGMAKQDISDSMRKASVFYMKGLSCQAVGDYAQAADSYRQAVEANPKHEYADYCVAVQGYCYEQLFKTGQITEAEANPRIKAAYTKLIAEYPSSASVPQVQKWLNENK